MMMMMMMTMMMMMMMIGAGSSAGGPSSSLVASVEPAPRAGTLRAQPSLSSAGATCHQSAAAPKCSEWHHQSEKKVMICTKLSDSVSFFSERKWKWKSDGWPFKAIWRRRRLASGKMQKWSLVALVGGLWKSPVMPRVQWVLLFRGFVSLKQLGGCNLIATRRGRSQFQFSERSRVFSENQAQLWLKYKRALTTNQLWLKQKGWGWLCDFNRNGFSLCHPHLGGKKYQWEMFLHMTIYLGDCLHLL